MDKVYDVGNVMVDNLLYQADQLSRTDTSGYETDAIKRRHARYGVVTLHRPSNVDNAEALGADGRGASRRRLRHPARLPRASAHAQQHAEVRRRARAATSS